MVAVTVHRGCINRRLGTLNLIQKPVRMFKVGTGRVSHLFLYKCFGNKLNYVVGS